MPSLGADMERGTLVEWLVGPGDYVHRGDLVAVVDTDKTVMDVECFEEGVVAELLVDVGATVPVGAAMARITPTPALVPPPEAPAAPAPEAPAGISAETAAVPIPGHPGGVPGHAAASKLSPPVRSLAHRLGVDVSLLRGTGRHGAVTRADVERAAGGAGPAAAATVPAGAGPAAARGPTAPAAAAPPARPAPEPAPPASAPSTRVRSSPRARRVAAELGIGLVSVRGTGPSGAITEADVRRAAAASARGQAGPAETRRRGDTRAAGVPSTSSPSAPPAPTLAAPAPPDTAPATPPSPRTAGLRRAVGALMSRSKQTIPHYYLGTTLDLGEALAWMRSANARRPVGERLVPAALLLKATALAAREVPEVNGFFVDGAFRPSPAVHLGVAVALRRGGLIAPAIHDADSLDLDAVMARLRDLVARARAGRLQRGEMADPTLTVTNLGDLGVESVYGVIYPPQVAMVGLGRVAERPWAEDGMLGVRPAATATLSADHRASDGLRGARFLALLGELLQKPEEL